jgi:mycothiol synthase
VTQLFMRRPRLDDLPPLPRLPPGHELRVATADDADGIAAIMASAFGPDWTVDRVRRELLDAEDVETTFVITSGGVPVATASLRLLPDRYPGSGYVHWVGVHAEHRGKRLGRAVSLAVLRRCRDLGCRDAVLETDPPRLPAIRTYLNLGFRPEHVVPEHEAVWQDILGALAPPVGP